MYVKAAHRMLVKLTLGLAMTISQYPDMNRKPRCYLEGVVGATVVQIVTKTSYHKRKTFNLKRKI